MRVDLLLVRLRFAKSRARAKSWVEEGHIRCNRQRVTCPGHTIKATDVLTLPLGRGVKIIEILSLPERRGGKEEAQSHYQTLDAGNSIAIASALTRPTSGEHEEYTLP